MRPCLGCGDLIGAGSRCDACATAIGRRRHNPAYDTAEYRRARNAAVARHVAVFGWVCLGDGRHAGHPTRDLTADHPVPLSKGGAIVQEFVICCRSANSGRGARVGV